MASPSASSATGKRTRSSTPRVRTGCQTCRKRHVKCDETKPSCLKCTRAGWKCDGYPTHTNLQPPTSDNAVAKRTSPELPLSITSYSIPFRIPGSQKDRQTLHYFYVQGSHDVAGFLSSNFWSKVVLQHSYHEPVVRQALVSLGSLHLDYITTDAPGDETARSDTLVQYGRAIRILRKRLESPSPEATRAALVCCILFYCFENTLGNTQAAMHHLSSGLNLLSSYRRDQRGEDGDDLGELSSVFERLDLQATFFDDDRVPCLELTSEEGRETYVDDLLHEKSFSRFEDAHHVLIKLLNWLFHFLTKNACFKFQTEESIPPAVLYEKSRLVVQLDRWLRNFNNFRSQADQDDQTVCGMNILLMQWRIPRMLLDANYPADESVFGVSPNPAAEEIVQLADTVLRLTRERNKSAEAAKNPRRSFSSETGVVAPLFGVAMKCSDISVCHRAVSLLTASQRREGFYDAQTMVAIINKLRDIGDVTNLPLENYFLTELEEGEGGMDRLVDFT